MDNYIKIPTEFSIPHQNVTLAIDVVTVNSLHFLTTISRNLYYRNAHYLPNSTAHECQNALEDSMRIYKLSGFIITEILPDDVFLPLIRPFGITYNNLHLNFANPQEYVPEAERNKRVIQDLVRDTYHCLSFRHLPRNLYIYLVSECTKKLNFFPAKYGVSKYYSLRMIINQQNLYYEKHCKIVFGTYVVGHNKPTILNTNAADVLDGIYIRYNSNHQGGLDFLHLQTNRPVIRQNVTTIPITSNIIKQVNDIARHKKWKKD